MIDLEEYKPIDECMSKPKWPFLKSLYMVVKGMLKYKRFVFVYTNLENDVDDYELKIYWYGLNGLGLRKALSDLLETEKQLDKTVQKANDILNNKI